MDANKTASNTASNTRPPPPPDERARLKRDHRIGWHPNGGWCRKFPGDRNRTYFGHVPAPAAIEACAVAVNRRKTGAEPAVRLANLSLGEAANLFLNHLDRNHAAGKIGDEQRASYGQEIHELITLCGKGRKLREFCTLTAPESLYRPLRDRCIKRGLHAAEKHIIQVRTFLEWCSRVRRYISAPFYADEFDPPSEREKRTVRKAERREKGQAAWSAADIREIVSAAQASSIHRYAQLLLMLNGGMGSTDLSLLNDADVDWERRCIHTDRSKTLVPRVVPLWNVTLAAMRASQASRAETSDPAWAGRFFLTEKGLPLISKSLSDDRRKRRGSDSVKNWFYSLLNGKERMRWKQPAVRLPHLKRHRAGGYTLRAAFVSLSIGHGQDRNLDAVILGQKFTERPIIEFYLRGDMRNKLVAIVNHVFSQVWPEKLASEAAEPIQ